MLRRKPSEPEEKSPSCSNPTLPCKASLPDELEYTQLFAGFAYSQEIRCRKDPTKFMSISSKYRVSVNEETETTKLDVTSEFSARNGNVLSSVSHTFFEPFFSAGTFQFADEIVRKIQTTQAKTLEFETFDEVSLIPELVPSGFFTSQSQEYGLTTFSAALRNNLIFSKEFLDNPEATQKLINSLSDTTNSLSRGMAVGVITSSELAEMYILEELRVARDKTQRV